MRKIIKKVSIAVVVVLVIVIALHIALFAFINAKGRDLIVVGLRNNFGLESTMDSLSLKFPFNLEINDFECEALSFKQANISLGFFNPFTRNISLSKVYLNGLSLKIAKDQGKISLSLPSQGISKDKERRALAQKGFSLDNFNAENKPGKEEDKAESKATQFSLAIGNFYLKNSRVEVDYPIKNRPLNIIFSDLSLRVKGFTYPELSSFYVKLNTVLASPYQESQKANTLGIEGSVDYNNKNMDVDINIDDFDYIAFSRSYPNFWQPNNLRLKEAALSFKSNLKSKGNILTIDNLLTIEEVEFAEEEGEEEPFQAKTLKTVISFLKGDKDKPTLHFKLTTSMDSPKLDFSSLKKSLLGEIGIGPLTIIEGVVDEVKEKVKEAGEATVGGVIGTLKDAAGTFEEIFKIGSE